MGLLEWFFGTRYSEPAIGRPTIVDIVVHVPGDDGFPATAPQLEALRHLGCGALTRNITLRQASAILSARDFSRFVLDDALRRGERQASAALYAAMQANIIAFIVRHPPSRDAVCAWNTRNYDEGTDDPPPHDKHWREAVAFISPVVEKLSAFRR